MIELQQLVYTYNQGLPTENRALKGINLSIKQGEIVGIIGATGSGKSTLIQHLNGLLKPTSGTVLYQGKNPFESKESMRALRFKVGVVFQYPEYQLFEETVYRDIAYGPSNMKLSEQEVKKRVLGAAKFVGLDDQLLKKSPFSLSGGQKRRVAIGGILAMEPEVLVLDEPAAGLDPAGKRRIFQQIIHYQKVKNATVILVSHSMEDVAEYADRVVVLKEGEIAMDGEIHEVFQRGEELKSMGLSVPEITQIFQQLQEEHPTLPQDIFTVEQGIEAICSYLEGEKIC